MPGEPCEHSEERSLRKPVKLQFMSKSIIIPSINDIRASRSLSPGNFRSTAIEKISWTFNMELNLSFLHCKNNLWSDI